jgi:hypothetical protein
LSAGEVRGVLSWMSWLRREAIAAVLVCVLSVAGMPAPSSAGALQASGSGSTTGPLALGVNVAAWDSIEQDVDAATVTNLLKSAGLRLLRFPGGSWADEYDWSTDTDSSHCLGAAAGSCSEVDPLSFGDLSTEARSAGASIFATVNYGSGTPSEAAAWVTRSVTTDGEKVALWEVGNETYSCDETNQHMAESPTFIKSYSAGGPQCPSTALMTASYATNVLPYLEAMKRADPDAEIGVPWAFSGTEAPGEGVKDASLWNAKVLRAVKGDISFVDAHWYPFDRIAGLTDQQILQSTRRIPAAAAKIRLTLQRDAPRSRFLIGETNVSDRVTTLDFQPVSALFAAATSLMWLSQGAQSVDWWDFNNFGSPTKGDYGLVSSGGSESEPAGTPFPPFYGEALASMLASSGSHIETDHFRSTELLGFTSDLGDARRVLLVNANPSAVASVADRWFTPGSHLNTLTFDASTAGAINPIVGTTATAGESLMLPAESIVVLTGTVGDHGTQPRRCCAASGFAALDASTNRWRR